MFQISADGASECPDDNQDMLEEQANAGDKPVAEGDGQAEGSNEQVNEGNGCAPEAQGRAEQHGRTGQTGESDETMELQLRAEGGGRGMEGDSMVEDGVVFFMIDGAWRQVRREHWAWTSLAQHTTYRRCDHHRCDSPFDCLHGKVVREYKYSDWIPKVRRPFKLYRSLLWLIACS